MCDGRSAFDLISYYIHGTIPAGQMNLGMCRIYIRRQPEWSSE